MPTITLANSIDIRPQRFVDACTTTELYELWMIMNSNSVQLIITSCEEPKVPEAVNELEYE